MSQSQVDPALAAAENYERNVVTYSTGPFASILLEHANPQPGEHVIDIACGTGVVARQTAPRVGETGAVVGVDVNPHMIAVASNLTSNVQCPQGRVHPKYHKMLNHHKPVFNAFNEFNKGYLVQLNSNRTARNGQTSPLSLW